MMLDTLLIILDWDILAPEIIKEEDGSLGLDWKDVSVSIAPNGSVAWAAIKNKEHGTDLDRLRKFLLMADYNAADPRHVKGRKGQEKREQLRDEDAFKFVMGDIRGRNFIWSLLDEYIGLYRDSFTGNNSTFYNEGRRSVGLKLIKDLEGICPDEFITMWHEHLIQAKKDEKEDEAIRVYGNGEEF